MVSCALLEVAVIAPAAMTLMATGVTPELEVFLQTQTSDLEHSADVRTAEFPSLLFMYDYSGVFVG